MTNKATQSRSTARSTAPGRESPVRAKARRIEKRGSAQTPDRRVLSRLREKMGLELCDRYFERVAKVCEGTEGICVRVPSEFVAGVIERRFGAALSEATRSEMGVDRGRV